MDAYPQLTAHLARIESLDAMIGQLSWDQQTFMPSKAGPGRGEQVALLSGVRHDLMTDPRVGDWLGQAEASLAEEAADTAASLARIRREVTRAQALPPALVARRAKLGSDGFGAWMAAREANDPSLFLPMLAELLEVEKEVAARIDPDRPAYDVMMEASDPGVTTEALVPLFARLSEGLRELLDALEGRPVPPGFDVEIPTDVQLAWHHELLDALGYDLEAGRLDQAEHPFTVRTGPSDVRITTRVRADDVLSGLYGTVHEAGHGMYEQGMPHRPGTMLGEAASLGLHESQSRLWENGIGRSEAFVRYAASTLARRWGQPVDADAMLAASRRVERSLVRVEADEVTYNLHIIVRFELERALVRGELAVADLPDAWNEAYLRHLGVRVPDARSGVLQDVHWSGGTFGYFPSYTLGNLYAASLLKGMEAAVPTLWDDVAAGRFGGARGWLRTHVHGRGAEADADTIVRDAVGPRDAVADLLDALWARYGAAYGVARG